MSPAEFRDTLESYRDALKNNAVCLEVFLRTGEQPALKRFAKARKAEDQLLQVILAEDHAATVVKQPHVGKQPALDEEEAEDAKRRLDRGETLSAIAKALGVPRHSIRNVVDRIANEAQG